MGGKAALILVLGFAGILGYISMNVNTLATKAVGNMAMYNAMTASHNLALAGANARLAKFYQDSSDLNDLTETFAGQSFVGSFTVKMEKVAWNRLRLRSISTYPVSAFIDIHDTIEVYFNTVKKNSFTLFAWMTDFEGNMFWVGNDTIWGRAHSNGRIHINGSPVFMKKATTAKAFDPPKVGTGANKAIFKDGYETGIAPIAFPTDISELITAGSGGGRKYIGDVYVVLTPGSSANNDGMVYIRSGNLPTGPLIDSIDLSNPGFNGAVVSTGRVNVEGTLDGKLSIGSQTNIFVQDNLYYERNPRIGSSDDLLGLVAEQNVIVADNAANKSSCEIYGNVFTRTGSLFAENVSSLPICGNLVVYGSVVQQDRGAIGTYSGSNLKTGFAKSFRYDDRLADGTFMPPFYPGYYVSTYAITNWWESYRIMEFE